MEKIVHNIQLDDDLNQNVADKLSGLCDLEAILEDINNNNTSNNAEIEEKIHNSGITVLYIVHFLSIPINIISHHHISLFAEL